MTKTEEKVFEKMCKRYRSVWEEIDKHMIKREEQKKEIENFYNFFKGAFTVSTLYKNTKSANSEYLTFINTLTGYKTQLLIKAGLK